MGSSYLGEPNMGGGSGSGGGGGGSSRKGGKKSNSNKPKQPQRGLGVAQLEKIRLHGQMGFVNPYPSSSSSSHHNFLSNQQAEETRLHAAAAAFSSSFGSSQSSLSPPVSYGFHPNMMMGHGEYDERANIICGDHSQLNSATSQRWEPSNAMLQTTQHFVQPSIATRHLLNPPPLLLEDYRRKEHRSNSMGSSSQNSESSDTQEVDLELRL